MAVSVTYNVSFVSSAQISSSSQPPGTAPAWVVNYDTDAHVMYENYNFDSFCKFGGRYYGIKSGGLYLLEGTTDAGTSIQTGVVMPTTDMGLAQQKRVDKMYVGGFSAGELRMIVTTNGVPYTYPVTPKSGISGSRVEIGRGIVSRYWQFSLYNVAGAHFDVDSITVTPTVLRRRER